MVTFLHRSVTIHSGNCLQKIDIDILDLSLIKRYCKTNRGAIFAPH